MYLVFLSEHLAKESPAVGAPTKDVKCFAYFFLVSNFVRISILWMAKASAIMGHFQTPIPHSGLVFDCEMLALDCLGLTDLS